MEAVGWEALPLSSGSRSRSTEGLGPIGALGRAVGGADSGAMGGVAGVSVATLTDRFTLLETLGHSLGMSLESGPNFGPRGRPEIREERGRTRRCSCPHLSLEHLFGGRVDECLHSGVNDHRSTPETLEPTPAHPKGKDHMAWCTGDEEGDRRDRGHQKSAGEGLTAPLPSCVGGRVGKGTKGAVAWGGCEGPRVSNPRRGEKGTQA